MIARGSLLDERMLRQNNYKRVVYISSSLHLFSLSAFGVDIAFDRYSATTRTLVAKGYDRKRPGGAHQCHNHPGEQGKVPNY